MAGPVPILIGAAMAGAGIRLIVNSMQGVDNQKNPPDSVEESGKNHAKMEGNENAQHENPGDDGGGERSHNFRHEQGGGLNHAGNPDDHSGGSSSRGGYPGDQLQPDPPGGDGRQGNLEDGNGHEYATSGDSSGDHGGNRDGSSDGGAKE